MVTVKSKHEARILGSLVALLCLFSTTGGVGCLKLLAIPGSVIAPRMTNAYHLAEEGHCREAIPELEASLGSKEFPAFDGMVHYGLAGCRFVVGDLDRAAAEARIVTEKYPSLAYGGHVLLAWIRYAQDDLDGAVASSDAAVRTAPDNERAQQVARAVQTTFHLIRDGRAFDDARNLGDCDATEKLARTILAQHPYGAFDIVGEGTRVVHVRRGGMAEMSGILEGDQILAIDGDAVTSTSELGEAEAKLRTRYGDTIPIELIRRGVPGAEPATEGVERRLTIQVRLEYPEMLRAKAFLEAYPRDRSTLCKVAPGGPGDRIPPQILVLEPKSRDLVIHATVAKSTRLRFVVLASDNVDVRSLDVDGVAGIASEPNDLEKTFLPGKVRKFALDVPSSARARSVVVRAIDGAGNHTETKLDVVPGKAVALGDGPLFRSSVALVVGIDRYREAPPLEFAARDARSVAARLRAIGFERVVELYDADATRSQILRVFSDELPGVLAPEDRFVFFFAGHGQTDAITQDQQEGYLIPYDGSVKDFRGTGISMSKVHEVIRRVRANQMLLAFDSCYSGLGLKRSLPPQVTPDFIRKLAGQRAVQIITAGGKDEQAAESEGHGLFTKYLLAALDGAGDSDQDGYLLGSEIGTYVRRRVSEASDNRQTPLWGWVAGDGDFLFDLHR